MLKRMGFIRSLQPVWCPWVNAAQHVGREPEYVRLLACAGLLAGGRGSLKTPTDEQRLQRTQIRRRREGVGAGAWSHGHDVVLYQIRLGAWLLQP